MQVILENYLVFILIGLFIVFALIGYLIDILRKNNNNNEETIEISKDIPSDIKEIEISKIEENNILNTNTEIKNQSDILLENYDNNNEMK